MRMTFKLLTLAALAVALAGCVSNPVNFAASSAPIPPHGYTVLDKKPVKGTNTQVWLLGFGGSTASQQFAALQDALEDGPDGTDALISVAIEENLFTFLFYTSKTTSVTGIPVKFNK